MDPFVYAIPSAIGGGKLRKSLPDGRGYEVLVNKSEKTSGTLLDTFENDVLQSQKLLFKTGDLLIVIDLKEGITVHQEIEGEWCLASDLIGGPVKEKLLAISKLRAFMPVVELQVRVDKGAVLDDEKKTRARFRNIVLFLKDRVVTLGSTQYLRGYQRAHQDLVNGLRKIGASDELDCTLLYRTLGVKRLEYDPKPLVPLDGSGSAKETAVAIIKTFIKVARANEKGVVGDYDTEFLHDYRVSFRKVRSVLSLFKGVFSPEQTIRLKGDFANLMKDTNRLRDLDVYLLEEQNYFGLVPETAHQGLSALFGYLKKERNKELKKVTKTLKNKAYRRQLKDLQDLFDDRNNLKDGVKAQASSLNFGSKLILKRYNQVCQIAGKIDANTEDDIVHELRISCKKLRYLMEFFTPLFDAQEIKSLIKSLKVLQDNLGNFNDFSVQQGFLRQIVLSSLPQFGKNEIQVTESIGALTAMLYRLQLKERKQVMKNFARFDSEETRALVKKLFQDKGEK